LPVYRKSSAPTIRAPLSPIHAQGNESLGGAGGFALAGAHRFREDKE
jgi:hypothetical protein